MYAVDSTTRSGCDVSSRSHESSLESLNSLLLTYPALATDVLA
jgi:hypothetical protein